MSNRGAAIVAAVLLLTMPLPAVGQDGRVPLVAPAGSDAAARAAVAALPRATAVNDADGNKLFDDLDQSFRTSRGGRVPVIVSFVAGTSTPDGVAGVRDVAPDAVVRRSFEIIPAFAGDLTSAEAARVAALGSVRQLELDSAGSLELDTATHIMGADAVVDQLGVTGSLDGQPDVATSGDVGIAVLDTGFHTAHQELRDKLIAWRDFGTNRTAPYDPDGHGTHVANIAAGWGANPAYRGVAPGASLIGVKIDGGANTESSTIAGYEWIVQRKAELNVRVATISFGFGAATDGTSALERAVDAAWNAGIVCFKSNGNSGPGKSTMTVPAAARGIIAVGNILDPKGVPNATAFGFALSHSSSRGPTSDGRVKPDLVAPGSSIMAADAPTSSGYVSLSGTSMASPFAAGAAALMIAANPALGPDETRSIMTSTTADFGAPGADNEYGHGRLRVWHAVAEVLRRQGLDTGTSTPPAVPNHQAFATATPTTGVFETAVTVRDTAFPVAVTAIGDTAVGAVGMFDAAGNAVGGPTSLPNNGPDRQHGVSFASSAPGTYTLRVVAPPTSPLVVDVSHSTAE